MWALFGRKLVMRGREKTDFFAMVFSGKGSSHITHVAEIPSTNTGWAENSFRTTLRRKT